MLSLPLLAPLNNVPVDALVRVLPHHKHLPITQLLSDDNPHGRPQRPRMFEADGDAAGDQVAIDAAEVDGHVGASAHFCAAETGAIIVC
jgi:hypothetical protein